MQNIYDSNNSITREDIVKSVPGLHWKRRVEWVSQHLGTTAEDVLSHCVARGMSSAFLKMETMQKYQQMMKVGGIHEWSKGEFEAVGFDESGNLVYATHKRTHKITLVQAVGLYRKILAKWRRRGDDFDADDDAQQRFFKMIEQELLKPVPHSA